LPEIKGGFGRGVDVAQRQSQQYTDTKVPDWIKSGARIKDVKFASGETEVTVQHKLQRKIEGWSMQRLRQSAGDFNVIYEVSSDEATIRLARDAQNADPCTLDLWVF